MFLKKERPVWEAISSRFWSHISVVAQDVAFGENK